MSEELKFKKLSEVEIVEKPATGAHMLIEEGGKIKRAAEGITGPYIFDVTKVWLALMILMGSDEQSLIEDLYIEYENMVTYSESIEKTKEILNGIHQAKQVILHVDTKKAQQIIEENNLQDLFGRAFDQRSGVVNFNVPVVMH